MPTRSLAMLLAVALGISACGQAPPNPRRERYEADKARCDSLSQDGGARKSCMTYRGWPDGKYR